MVKNITLSADDSLIRRAREKAACENRSLNSMFRQWLERYVAPHHSSVTYDELMSRLKYVKPGRHFSREEMNER